MSGNTRSTVARTGAAARRLVVHMTVLERAKQQQPPRSKPKQYIIVCAWCKKSERKGDTWGPRTTQLSDDQLSHGICPECFRREVQRVAR